MTNHESRTTTRQAFLEAIRNERRLLAADVERLSEYQWTAESGCAGWTVGEVANHLMLADRFPTNLGWRGMPKLILYGLRGRQDEVFAAWQRKMATRGQADTAKRLRESPLPWTARRLGRFGARLNLLEHLVHMEDFRRPLGLTGSSLTLSHPDKGNSDERSRITNDESRITSDALWEGVRLASRLQRRKLRAPGRLALITTDGRGITVRKGTPFGRIDDLSREEIDALLPKGTANRTGDPTASQRPQEGDRPSESSRIEGGRTKEPTETLEPRDAVHRLTQSAGSNPPRMGDAPSDSTGSEHRVDAIVFGPAIELILFLVGRRAEVSVEGQGELADAARRGGLVL